MVGMNLEVEMTDLAPSPGLSAVYTIVHQPWSVCSLYNCTSYFYTWALFKSLALCLFTFYFCSEQLAIMMIIIDDSIDWNKK